MLLHDHRGSIGSDAGPVCAVLPVGNTRTGVRGAATSSGARAITRSRDIAANTITPFGDTAGVAYARC